SPGTSGALDASDNLSLAGLGLREPNREGWMSPAVESFLALSAARLAPRTVEAYRRDLADLEAWLGGSPADATAEQLAAYVAQLRADGLAATTLPRRFP